MKPPSTKRILVTPIGKYKFIGQGIPPSPTTNKGGRVRVAVALGNKRCPSGKKIASSPRARNTWANAAGGHSARWRQLGDGSSAESRPQCRRRPAATTQYAIGLVCRYPRLGLKRSLRLRSYMLVCSPTAANACRSQRMSTSAMCQIAENTKQAAVKSVDSAA
jgi:hypothetical protein